MTQTLPKHAPKPPSGAPRWAGCAGSLTLESLVPEGERGETSEFAMLGTAAHDLLERCVKESKRIGETVWPGEYKGRLIEVFEGENEGTSMLRKGAKLPKDPQRHVFEVDEDMIESVETTLEVVTGALEFYTLDWGAVEAESRTHALPERDDCYGTVDITVDAWPDLLLVVDHKNGSHVTVEIGGNKQTRLYLLGKAIESDFSHDRYKHVISQPRKAHEDGPVRDEEVTADELRGFHAEMLRAAEKSDEAMAAYKIIGHDVEGAPRTFEEWAEKYLDPGPHGEHCTWCTAVACPAALALAAASAGADFEDEPYELEVPNTPERLGEFLLWVPFLDGLCKKAEVQGQRYLESGGDTERLGHKFVRKGSPGRRWKDDLDKEELPKVLAKRFGKKPGDFKTRSVVMTGPQVEKVLDKEDRADFEEEFLFKPEGGLKLVPLSDEQEEVVVDPGGDFEDEEL